MSNIEEDMKRCEQLIKPEHANWLGISNQLSIAHLIKRIKELEEENRIYLLNGNNVKLEIYIKDNYIPKQKVKDKLEELKKEYIKELEKNSTKAFILKCQIEILEKVLEDR